MSNRPNTFSIRILATAATAVLMTWSQGVLAQQDYGQSLYESTTPTQTPSDYSASSSSSQAGYEADYGGVLPTPGVQGGGIIGYQPVSPEALAAAAKGQVVAGMAPVQPLGMTANTGLPTSYETGVIGDGNYTLGRDDVIRITVRNQPDFSGDFAVGFNGRIQYNYFGDFPVAGLTKYELQQALEKLLEKYIRVPSVSVQIMAYNSKVVYVVGEVSRPGKYIMRGDAIKLREAIIAAGLPNYRSALKRVHVITPDLKNPEVRKINLKNILYKGKLAQDIDLTPGEIVVVPTKVLTKIGDVLGDILNPVSRSQALNAARVTNF